MGCLLDPRKLRYALGAILAAGLNNTILIVGDHYGVEYAPLVVLCYFISGTLTYVFHSAFTFQRELSWSAYLLFMLGLLAGVPISIIVLYFLCSVLHLPMWISAAVLTVAMLIYNFMSAKFATTRRTSD